MIPTKQAALAIAACLAGALGSGVVAAQADSSVTPPTGATAATAAPAAPATITINGSGSVTLDAGASTGDVSSGYLSALTAALGDAHTKAAALSAAVGDTLGAVENVTEQSTDDGLCSGPVFMNAAGAPTTATSTPGKHSHHKAKPSHKVARIAIAAQTSCTVTADVTVTWTMAPS
jgi:uncharacterized protein YggE